jgi:hypothetical protein
VFYSVWHCLLRYFHELELKVVLRNGKEYGKGIKFRCLKLTGAEASLPAHNVPTLG